MQSSAVSVERRGAITIIAIERPQARNALDAAAVAGMEQAFRAFNQDDAARIGIVHGRGGSFCAGADLKEMAHGPRYRAWAGDASGWLGTPLAKPLIAAVEGHAVAGGLGLALYCDIRIADETAVFGVFCRRFGVPMSDGTTVRLPRLIGEARAMHMMLTGCAVTAAQALRYGLVSEVVARGSALARAHALAETLAAFPQGALRSDRRSLLESRGLTLDAALRNEARLAEAAKQADAQEGAARFADGEGRHGRFDDV